MRIGIPFVGQMVRCRVIADDWKLLSADNIQSGPACPTACWRHGPTGESAAGLWTEPGRHRDDMTVLHRPEQPSAGSIQPSGG